MDGWKERFGVKSEEHAFKGQQRQANVGPGYRQMSRLLIVVRLQS